MKAIIDTIKENLEWELSFRENALEAMQKAGLQNEMDSAFQYLEGYIKGLKFTLKELNK